MLNTPNTMKARLYKSANQITVKYSIAFNFLLLRSTFKIFSVILSLKPRLSYISIIVLFLCEPQHCLYSTFEFCYSTCSDVPIASQIFGRKYLEFEGILILKFEIVGQAIDYTVFFLRKSALVLSEDAHLFVCIGVLVYLPLCHFKVLHVLPDVPLSLLHSLYLPFPPLDILLVGPEGISLGGHFLLLLSYLLRDLHR